MSVSIKVDKNTAIDLVKCPHVLVGGTTGSGKSYLMKCMLRNVLESSECRVIVVDPKCVDYQFLITGKNYEPGYVGTTKAEGDLLGQRLTKLWCMRGISMYDAEGIDDTSILRMLVSLVQEMRSRYNYMKKMGYVQWAEYLCDTTSWLGQGSNVNEVNCLSESDEYHFYESKVWGDRRLVLFIDELADLVYADRDKSNKYRGRIEAMLIKLSTLGRAAGIHLILGTQRPDATILSGQLRANIPTRIGLKCNNSMERRIILGDSCSGMGERVLYYGGEYKELVRTI